MCCTSAETRPPWVIDALADCSKCKAGEFCDFMDNARAKDQPIGEGGPDKVEGVESNESSLWEGEGSSDSLSSDAQTKLAANVSKKRQRRGGKQKDSRSKSPLATGDKRDERPLANGSGCKGPLDKGGESVQRLKVLLIGDSNACGYCETSTRHSVITLEKALSAYYDITVAARSGTSWVKLSKDVHGQLGAFSEG